MADFPTFWQLKEMDDPSLVGYLESLSEDDKLSLAQKIQSDKATDTGMTQEREGMAAERQKLENSSSFGSGFNLGGLFSGAKAVGSGLLGAGERFLENSTKPLGEQLRGAVAGPVDATAKTIENPYGAGKMVAGVVPGGATAYDLALSGAESSPFNRAEGEPTVTPADIGSSLSNELGAYATGAALPVVGRGIKKAAPVVWDVLRGKTSAAADAMREGAVGALHGFPATGTPGSREMSLADDLKKSAPVIEKYGIVKNIKTNLSDPISNQAAGVQYATNIDNALDEIGKARNTILSIADDAAKSGGIPKIQLDDIDFGALDDLIKEADTTAFKVLDSDTASKIKSLAKGTFETEVATLADGTKLMMRVPRSATEVKALLDSVYDELRKANAYDAAFQSKGIADPSVFAKNEATIAPLKKAAEALRKALGEHTDAVLTTMGRDDLKGAFNQLGDDYHNLKPVQQAADRYDFQTDSGLAKRGPTTLVKTIENAPIRNTIGGAVNLLAKPVQFMVDNINKRAALRRPGELVEGLQRVMDYRYGRATVPLPRAAVKIFSDPAASVMAGTLMADLGLARSPNELQSLPENEAGKRMAQAAEIAPDLFESPPDGYQSLFNNKLYSPMDQASHMSNIVASNLPLDQEMQAMSALWKGGQYVPVGPPRQTMAQPTPTPTPNPELAYSAMLEPNTEGVYDLPADRTGGTEMGEQLMKMKQLSAAYQADY